MRKTNRSVTEKIIKLNDDNLAVGYLSGHDDEARYFSDVQYAGCIFRRVTALLLSYYLETIKDK